MLTFIRKRDGRLVSFEEGKITQAIQKAVRAVGGSDMERAAGIARQVVGILEVIYKDERIPTVENVQDLVEKILIENGHAKVAKAYILYRKQHESLRSTREFMREAIESIDSYLAQEDWRVNENANMGYSLQGLNNHIASNITSNYWLNKIYPEYIAAPHRDADYHLHDLGMLSVYCCGWDLKEVLLKGFTGAYGKVQSGPPKHFRTALGQVVNFFYTLQGEAAGAQAFANFDTLLAPFIRFDGLGYAEVKQAMQEFIFNMNVPTRVGFQTPFTNITLDMTPPSTLAPEAVIIGGQLMEACYGEFQEEMDLFNRAFCEVMMAGDASGRIFSFPIPTYNLTRELDWDSPRFQPIWEMTAKYGIPYFSNFINSDMSPEDARSMCPLHPDTKIVVRAGRGIHLRTIKDVYYTHEQKGTAYEVLHNGTWVAARPVATPSVGCLEFALGNGEAVTMDLRHEQPVKRGKGRPVEILTADRIEEGFYLPFNATPLAETLDNQEAGFAVGAFLGDGSHDGKGSLVYSLNSGEKEEKVARRLRSFFESLGFKVSSSQETRGVVFHLVRGSNGSAEAWMAQFVSGRSAHEKRLTAWAFQLGSKFLEGLLAGWYATDGGNRGRIYTVNPSIREDFAAICGMLGKAYLIDRNGDERDNRLGENPVYTLKFHSRSSYGEHFFLEDGYYWFPVRAIRKMDDFKDLVFCVAVDSAERLFQLANGLVTHNCRLRLDNRELRRRGGGLFGSNPLTGSIGVVTLNLPRAAYLADSKEAFFARIAELMDIARDSLEIKRKQLERFTEHGLYPYSRFYLQGIKERSGNFWDNHFSTIGLIGMNEACLNLIGRDITTPGGLALAKDTLEFMRAKLEAYQEETGHLYNLEATPGEGTSFRLARADRERYPELIAAGHEQPYYTNSTQLPVGSTDDIFQALRHQDQLQTRYTGGTVFHGFLGERLEDWQSARLLARRIAENFHLPYFTITPTFTICPEHGYIAGEHFACPHHAQGQAA
ncbi:ribonucleoside triphosphate reductase [Geoalkalibacter sp.]|uniref:ribonucleoside triphosphate reductase n=1 Tax=Geoalkalibacter sp. TaxID=3041440 RepID=UPI00272E20D1|nr:ribonucleoside triphosphate reductase [Geoalkalibacter sp.]